MGLLDHNRTLGPCNEFQGLQSDCYGSRTPQWVPGTALTLQWVPGTALTLHWVPWTTLSPRTATGLGDHNGTIMLPLWTTMGPTDHNGSLDRNSTSVGP